ncbi:MAG TPA: T9SS type A sorting domain-containing protein, partial [Ferruginibacter sp.]|nr:T9SS type A sorting domain-containing protein [Ferruginibacter sp.]
GIVALSIDDSKSMVMLYPNPVTSEANLSITVNRKQKIQARIIDNAGRIVKRFQWNISAGSTSLPVDVKELAAGIYYLELVGTTINERKVFIKQYNQ